ncbi:polysaccharide biosynthesis/export family protein [Roseisalinus antarcticus]|uniref:Polysaccharide biosynthesis/export protein n=1 Tax=Roseisalinus antarcticus TaxID=254357 RepID=A0A1Y5TKC6_9RHOB|nr:polysaccharide biosynthesis/export family protein [Roseisalinus antarcticus]SLN66099.1 Polysaccharide biosynthesis/export protein [Roseisalinus antarcticus]
MRPILGVFLALLVAGCGAVYTSPRVLESASDGARVRVVEMNAETVELANRASYTPRALPAIFDVTAGTGSGLRGAGALPEPPFTPEARPGRLALRPPPPVSPGPYQIGVGDLILLATPNSGNSVEELTGLLAAQSRRQGYTVQDDGSIAIPDVGRVMVEGLTLDEAEARLFQRLVENQIDPTFSIEIAEFNSRKVAIGGAVGNPTVVPVDLRPLTLDAAIAAAGGISATDQDFTSIRIFRDGTLYQIPLNDFYTQAGLQRLRLIDGDSVFVDTEYELDQAQAYFEQQIRLVGFRQQARANALAELQSEVALRRGELQEARQNFQTREGLGAVDRDYVYVTGEVGTQSRFTLPFEQTASLADALYGEGAGVPVRTGDVSEIYVLRGSSDPREFGAVTAWHLNASNVANLVLASRFELRPDDIVFVAEQPVTRWNRVVQQITPQLISVGVNASGI